MQNTRKYFTHDELLNRTRGNLKAGITRHKISELDNASFSNIDCLMSGLALFTFKFSSLLKFDKESRENQNVKGNLQRLFALKKTPCDTQMRERLDQIPATVTRQAFTNIFTLLQRSKTLENFQFFNGHYLISLDGTGVFSSKKVSCKNCCTKNHRNGQTTYHHQILGAALVHPDQKVVYPLAPEPIMKEDGEKKNDCERNAAKRWVRDFRREHPHLKTVILADGLSSNEPFISILKEHNIRFILVAKTTDHKYLNQWIEAADSLDKPTFTETKEGVTRTYSYMKDVPLNHTHDTCLVNVVCLEETKKGKTTHWVWVTDLPIDQSTIREFVKGARARWKIENETFNTLKNQGYEFKHNFGHGKKHLHTVLTHLMMLAFLIDQCLQHLNKKFQAAQERAGSKRGMWHEMLYMLLKAEVPDFETLYYYFVHPPPFKLKSIL